jgi:hypothetical protein
MRLGRVIGGRFAGVLTAIRAAVFDDPHEARDLACDFLLNGDVPGLDLGASGLPDTEGPFAALVLFATFPAQFTATGHAYVFAFDIPAGFGDFLLDRLANADSFAAGVAPAFVTSAIGSDGQRRRSQQER